MSLNQKIADLDVRAKLSSLWVFALLNVIRDIHELFRPGFLEEMMTGTVGDVQMRGSLGAAYQQRPDQSDFGEI